MGAWTLIQVVFDIFAAVGFFVILMRMSRAPKDDPRLSRGLQLLQSKISVIEDLSDRTELQVNQLTAILDQKAKEVQAKVQLAEQHVQAIRVSTERSLEVAKIFQDKIPHQEIIERKNTIKYVQAARMAHQGSSVDEICEKIDLPRGEIEFIAKVNRDQLVFSEANLPEWAKNNEFENSSVEEREAAQPQNDIAAIVAAEEPNANAQRLRAEIELAERQKLVEDLSRLQFEMQSLDTQLARETPHRHLEDAFEAPKVESNSLQRLGDEFRKACEAAEKNDSRGGLFPPVEHLSALIPQIFHMDEPAVPQTFAEASVETEVPRREISKDPEAARAKVQAALQYGERAKLPHEPTGHLNEHLSAQSQSQSHLAEARAMAKSASQEIYPAPQENRSNEPVIRKVNFPRI